MGKNRTLFPIPLRPVAPIKVLGSYDDFFREHLLDAVRADRERFGGGVDTYHANLLRIVKDYAGEVVDAESLSLKNLRNFLGGMRSQSPSIRVLDAYIQIVDPSARPRFFIDTYADNVGTVLADYLGSPVLSQYDRELQTTRLVGLYSHSPAGMAAHRDSTRFMVARRHTGSAYVLLYEFNGPRPGESEIDQLKLRTGVCVPQPTSFLCVMRDYLMCRRYVGSLHFTIERGSENREIPFLTMSTFVARERNYDAKMGDYEGALHDHIGSDRSDRLMYRRINDAKTITYLNNIVNSFAGVI